MHQQDLDIEKLHEFFNDEDEGEQREIWWERVLDDPAYNSVNDPDLWYLQIEDYKPEIIKFLRVLSTIPLWYLGFLFKDYEKTNEQGPCYCPFHKRFRPIMERMEIQPWMDHVGIQGCGSKTSKGTYSKSESLKQHCHDSRNWWHMLLKFFIMELFEERADEYLDDLNKLKPIKDGTEKLPAPPGERQTSHQEAERQTEARNGVAGRTSLRHLAINARWT